MPASPAPSSEFTLEVDGQTASTWAEVIARFDDANIYQSWSYGAVRWGETHLSHAVLKRQGQVVAAAQLRIAKPPLLPAGIAYLRWGPLCRPKGQSSDATVMPAMLAHLRREYVQRRGLALQVIPQVYAGTSEAPALEAAFAEIGFQPAVDLTPYRTVVVDLQPAAEEIRRHLDKKWRNQLNASERNGLVFEVKDGPEAYQEFRRLYSVMWDRKRFETSVDVEEFERIQQQLPGSARMQIFLATKDGVAVAALVCSPLGDTSVYLLGATDERARELKAAYFLHWNTMLWVKERGVRWYDLGGIDPETNPGGYHFKSGFGGADLTHVAPRMIPGGALNQLLLGTIAWVRRKRRPPTPAAAPVAAN